jgi:hypothetical protein
MIGCRTRPVKTLSWIGSSHYEMICTANEAGAESIRPSSILGTQKGTVRAKGEVN